MVPALGHEEPRASTGVSPASRTSSATARVPNLRPVERTDAVSQGNLYRDGALSVSFDSSGDAMSARTAALV